MAPITPRYTSALSRQSLEPVYFTGDKKKTGTGLGLSLSALLGISSIITLQAVSQDSYRKNSQQESPEYSKKDGFPDLKPDQLRTIRQDSTNGDLRAQETGWADQIGLYAINRLSSFYEADNAGKTQLHYGGFVLPGEIGADRGKGPSLHVLKFHDETLSDGTEVRTYVNEYWPMEMKTGSLLLPDLVRVRVVSLRKEQAEPDIITDQLNILWAENSDGSRQHSPMPVFYRQHLYGEKDPKTGRNAVLQVRDHTSSPSSCIGCHNGGMVQGRQPVSSLQKALPKRDTEVESILEGDFPKAWRETEAMTPAKNFHDQLPVTEHPGYKDYLAYLTQRSLASVDKKTAQLAITPAFIQQVAEDLRTIRNMRVPNMVYALKPYQKKEQAMEWTEGDILLNPGSYRRAYNERQPVVPYSETVKMKDANGKVISQTLSYERAGYSEHLFNQIGLGTWWYPDSPSLFGIPVFRNEKRYAVQRYPEASFPPAKKIP